MERTPRMGKTIYLIAIFLVCALYFVIRLSFPETIEFGYDQPRLAYTVLDFIKSGTFLTSQNYSLATSWGNLSWGPLLVFFNALFLIITTNPIHVSQLMILFNLLSLVFIFLMASEFFSKKVAIISALTLAIHPWWIVFSRMIYQPTPVPTFIAASLFFLFKTIKNPKSIWIIPLILSWVLLLQSYLITISFIFVSLVIIIYETKLKVNYKYFFLAAILVIITFVPSIKYYFDNPIMFYSFLHFKGKFVTTFSDTFIGFVKTISGNNFEWQLGYAYNTFFDEAKYLKTLQYFNIIIVPILVLFGGLVSYISKNKYMFYTIILLMTPLLAIPVIGVEYIVPRYFLYILPLLSLNMAVAINYLIKKFGKATIAIPVAVFSSWLIFMFNYFGFIKSYNYPHGFVSNWSDVPYAFLDQSFKWIVKDSIIKGYDSFTISSDREHPDEFRLSWAQRYYWEYVLEKNETLHGEVGHYLMYYSPAVVDGNIGYEQFGPIIVYEYSTPQAFTATPSESISQ